MRVTRLTSSLLVVISAAVVAVMYTLQVGPGHEYLGYRLEIFSASSIVLTSVLLVAVIAMLPTRIDRPSDFFLLFYTAVVLFSCAVFNQVTGLLGPERSALLFAWLALPVLLIYGLRHYRFALPVDGVFPRPLIYLLLFVFLLTAALMGVKSGGAGGFGWESMYERRLAGRDAFGSRNLLAYLFAIATNGVGPFLGFVGTLRKRPILLTTGLAFGVFAFWLLGLKAPILMVMIFAALGYLVRKGWTSRFATLVLLGIATTAIAALVEFLIFDFSLVAEFLLRRAFILHAAIQTYYFDLLTSPAQMNLDSFLFGIDPAPNSSVTFLVGAEYLGRPEVNANTSAFLHAFAHGGLFLFVLASVFVAVFFTLADAMYRSSSQPELLFVGALYGLLLAEQSFSTAFISSGVGFLLVIVVITRRDRSTDAMPGKMAWG